LTARDFGKHREVRHRGMPPDETSHGRQVNPAHRGPQVRVVSAENGGKRIKGRQVHLLEFHAEPGGLAIGAQALLAAGAQARERRDTGALQGFPVRAERRFMA
jgi:hypothetical protein